ncbi:hypothetical protein [Pseudohoeflea coraliihabitans]|uniref:Uncharacterized protein n=1 Tax=Pseudohoeflea coraliihabitans TaxID=2860393 RepID=A0ABS6WLK5_9HYPH|nr:hypothetical protein [Pseudohoeflea sp. DP4N28-3]MBW3096844.1 hypothetical protein [Pseudohoeflea sp. DP4N28-3]
MIGFFWGILASLTLAVVGLAFKNAYGYAKVSNAITFILGVLFMMFCAGIVGFGYGAAAAFRTRLGDPRIDELLPLPSGTLILAATGIVCGATFILWVIGRLPHFLRDPNKKDH